MATVIQRRSPAIQRPEPQSAPRPGSPSKPARRSFAIQKPGPHTAPRPGSPRQGSCSAGAADRCSGSAV
eukprot:274354-Alexandrium_andersonii.AAC.1